MFCTVFSSTTPGHPCNRPADRFLPVALGANGKMNSPSDALMYAYAPLCVHHSEMVPHNVPLWRLSAANDNSLYRPSIDG